MGTNDRRRAELRSMLMNVFADAIGADRVVLKAEAIAAGIPANRAESVVMASRDITSEVDAVSMADELAEAWAAQEPSTPREIVDSIPRSF